MAAQTKIPEWVLQCLDQYGNCACGRNITKKMGKDKLLDELEILSDQKEKSAYPKEATYILTLKTHEILQDEEDED